MKTPKEIMSVFSGSIHKNENTGQKIEMFSKSDVSVMIELAQHNAINFVSNNLFDGYNIFDKSKGLFIVSKDTILKFKNPMSRDSMSSPD